MDVQAMAQLMGGEVTRSLSAYSNSFQSGQGQSGVGQQQWQQQQQQQQQPAVSSGSSSGQLEGEKSNTNRRGSQAHPPNIPGGMPAPSAGSMRMWANHPRMSNAPLESGRMIPPGPFHKQPGLPSLGHMPMSLHGGAPLGGKDGPLYNHAGQSSQLQNCAFVQVHMTQMLSHAMAAWTHLHLLGLIMKRCKA